MYIIEKSGKSNRFTFRKRRYIVFRDGSTIPKIVCFGLFAKQAKNFGAEEQTTMKKFIIDALRK